MPQIPQVLSLQGVMVSHHTNHYSITYRDSIN